jgi:hypothetical protein
MLPSWFPYALFAASGFTLVPGSCAAGGVGFFAGQ